MLPEASRVLAPLCSSAIDAVRRVIEDRRFERALELRAGAFHVRHLASLPGPGAAVSPCRCKLWLRCPKAPVRSNR